MVRHKKQMTNNNKKYKKYAEFVDNVHSMTFGVVLLNKKEMEKVCKKESMQFFDGYFDGENNNFVFYKPNPGVVAHEAFHGLEFTLFHRRHYTINLEGYNEHLAYYLDFLVANITDCLESLTKK